MDDELKKRRESLRVDERVGAAISLRGLKRDEMSLMVKDLRRVRG